MNALRSALTARRVAAGCCLGGCLLLSVEGLSSGSASAGEPGSYRASAAADGVRITVSAPGFLVAETLADGGAPLAQAVVDGLGTSRAFASLPYPGEAALTTPGLVATSGGLPAPPAYPFVASSVFPATPESKVDGPGHSLSARSEAAASSAVASAGAGAGAEPGGGSASLPSGGVAEPEPRPVAGPAEGPRVGLSTATAHAARDEGSGAVRAESASQARAVDVGGVLSIGSVTARAAVTRAPGGELVRESAFSADAVSVAGQRLAVTDKGLMVPGSGVPLADASPLTKALADAGVSVRYIGRVDDTDGVISPGLVVTQRWQVPNGPVVITELVFGRAVAHGAAGGAADGPLDLPADFSAELPAEVPAGPAGPPLFPEPVAAPATAAAVPAAVTGRRSGGSAGCQGSEARHEYFAPCFTASPPPEAPASAVVAPPVPFESALPVSAGRADPGPSTRASYAVLVVGGAVAAALSQLVRRFGVRS